MKGTLHALSRLFGEPAGGIVPRSGYTARLTVLTAAAMAFLAVFALALSVAAGRLAARWDSALSRTATVRVTATPGAVEGEVAAALAVLAETPGVASARRLSQEERQALLEPWFGPGLPVDALPIPELIEVVTAARGFDAEGLQVRLAAVAPGALVDDHTRWRRPLVDAAAQLRTIGGLSVALIVFAMAATVTLAAQASLAANRGVIEVLRLVGAEDTFIARAFVRRFTRRALLGAAGGALAGCLALVLLPAAPESGDFLTGLGFIGALWLVPLAIPPVAAAIAFVATRHASLRMLKELG